MRKPARNCAGFLIPNGARREADRRKGASASFFDGPRAVKAVAACSVVSSSTVAAASICLGAFFLRFGAGASSSSDSLFLITPSPELKPSRRFLMVLPRALPSFGRCLGPKMRSATPRMMRSSGIPRPKIFMTDSLRMIRTSIAVGRRSRGRFVGLILCFRLSCALSCKSMKCLVIAKYHVMHIE